MDFWKAFWKFLLEAFGIIATLLAISQWLVKLKINIPSWVLLGLILLLFSIMGFTLYWVSHSGGEENNPLLGPKIKKTRLKPSKEIMFILSVLAAEPSKRLKWSHLILQYGGVFKEKTITDLNLVMNELCSRGYVSPFSSQPDDICMIRDEGLSYFNKHRKKFEPIKKPPTGSEKIVAIIGSVDGK